MFRTMILAGAAALACWTLPAQAATYPYETEMFRLHEACKAGDRAACVRFGVIIGEHREHRADLERLHPDIFWWNH